MRRRKRMTRRHSRKNFRKGLKFHKKNIAKAPMRGGFRL